MKPATLVLVLCLVATALGAIHQMVCDQDPASTSKCDLAFGIPIVVLMAVACGVSGLAVLAMSEDS